MPSHGGSAAVSTAWDRTADGRTTVGTHRHTTLSESATAPARGGPPQNDARTERARLRNIRRDGCGDGGWSSAPLRVLEIATTTAPGAGPRSGRCRRSVLNCVVSGPAPFTVAPDGWHVTAWVVSRRCSSRRTGPEFVALGVSGAGPCRQYIALSNFVRLTFVDNSPAIRQSRNHFGR